MRDSLSWRHVLVKFRGNLSVGSEVIKGDTRGHNGTINLCQAKLLTVSHGCRHSE